METAMPFHMTNTGSLKPGDVLMLQDEPSNTTPIHKGIVAGQMLTGLLLPRNGGDSNLVHALIWTRACGGEPETAEASGTGIVRSTPLRPGLYVVYRPKDSNLGDWAAQVAMTWAGGPARAVRIRYNPVMTIQSVFHSSDFGPNAQARAESYAKDAFSIRPRWGAGGAFCSQFVIAAYQAAAGQLGIGLGGMLASDAQHCSVRMLHQLLATDWRNFDFAGTLRLSR